MAQIHTPLRQRGVFSWTLVARRFGRAGLFVLTLSLGLKLAAQGVESSSNGAAATAGAKTLQEPQPSANGVPIAAQAKSAGDSNIVNLSETRTAAPGLKSFELPSTPATAAAEMNAAAPANQIPSIRSLIWFNAIALLALTGLLLGWRKEKSRL